MTNLVKITIGYELLAKEKIHDNYAWHKKAWTLFEQNPKLSERKKKPEREKGTTPFLSRYMLQQHQAELLLVSVYLPVKPDWCGHHQWHHIEIDENYLSQKSYFFDLYANPTRSVKKPDGNGGYTKNGRRLTLMDESSLLAWLMRKGENHGFRLEENFPLQIGKPVSHHFNRKGKKGLHIGVRFQGALCVTAPDDFKKAFHEGIGTAKGFGFGMLMIKPAQI
jgi:CRISPR system Cascade subunit CasE